MHNEINRGVYIIDPELFKPRLFNRYIYLNENRFLCCDNLFLHSYFCERLQAQEVCRFKTKAQKNGGGENHKRKRQKKC